MSWFLGEGDISFPPTYRYERGSRDTYIWQKFKPTGVSSQSLPSCRTSSEDEDNRLGWCQGGWVGGSSRFGVLGCFSGLAG